MATGGASFDCADEQELPNWTVGNGALDDRLNNMDWGVTQKKANRTSEKNKKKFGVESRLTNDISPESSPGVGRRRARTPHSFSHVKYATQMSVPEQADLERLRQRINFTDLDERSIGSDSQGRVTAANNQRQLAENKKAFLPLHVNTNKSKELAASALASEDNKKQTPGRDIFASVLSKDAFQTDWTSLLEGQGGESGIDSSQVVSKLVQIREYIAKACCMRDDLLEKNDIPANVERLAHLIDHLKEQEKSCLRFLQKLLARENDEDDIGTIDSAVGSGSVAESTSLNIEVQSEASDATGRDLHGEAKEELENLRKQHALLKRMLQQQEQLRALQGRQAALLAMQQKAEQAIAVMDDTVITETTGSVSGISITSELNEELNDLIQRFHNQLHDSQTKAVPDNRRQAESLSLTREVSRSRSLPGPEPTAPANVQRTKLQELQDKKQTMDKILQELHTLRDHTLNNSSCQRVEPSSQRSPGQRAMLPGATAGRSAALNRVANSRAAARLDSSTSQHDTEAQNIHPAEKLRKLKEVHKRLNELRELVHYYEQTSDMMVDTVNENKDEDEETEEESIFEPLFDSEQENPEPITNIRNPQHPRNWMDMNSLTNAHSTSNRDGRLNTEHEINNRAAANLRSLNIPSAIECQYNRDHPRNEVRDNSDEEGLGDEEEAQRREGANSSASSRRSSQEEDPEFMQKVHRLRSAKEKLRHLQQLVAMVQSDDTDGATANASSVAEDEGLNQQPNNTRAAVPKSQRDVALTEKAREKFYEAKLKQQQQELRQLHNERQRLMEIKGEIQDLQWACPDLQLSGASISQRGPEKAPAATSTPAVNINGAMLNRTVEPSATSAPDNKLWSEMHRHQILREHLRQRRKQLESLMEEHQRRKVLNDTSNNRDSVKQPVSELSRDERTMDTWGVSLQPPLDQYEDSVLLDMGAGVEEEEEEVDTSSSEEFHKFSSRKHRSHGARKSRESCRKTLHLNSVSSNMRPSPRSKQQQQNVSMRRQENLRWASELSFLEEKQHWQEQISQLKKQLDFSTSICQTLMQDQQTLSYMLQTMLASPYSMMPNNIGSPQVHLIMHQLNHCYTQLAWQQNNVQRLKQVLNDLQRQQQSQPTQQSANHDSSACTTSSSVFPSFSLPTFLNTMNMPGPGNFSPLSSGFNFNPAFPPAAGELHQNPAAQAPTEPQLEERGAPAKPECMGFPQPFESSAVSAADKWTQKTGEGAKHQSACWLDHSRNGKADQLPSGLTDKGASGQKSSTQQPPRSLGSRRFDEESLGSLSSMPDPLDPTTVTKTFRSRKASAQASLASRDKTPKSKNKRKRSKGHGKKAGLESDNVSSVSDYGKGKGSQARQTERPERILEKLTQEKLDSKLKISKPNDLSSAYAWRTPFLSNRIACTEVQDASSDFSLFEALRETIYSEVATLISQNESRPHFLIELFHELQLLNTDYLRQRALFALQDIVTRHLTEKDTGEEQPISLSSAAWAASNSELTPSESLATSDADVSDKNIGSALHLSKKGNDGDSVDNESTLSTSSNLDPFASDDLGNTVIHLDKALARIREYERMKCNENVANASATDPGAVGQLQGPSDGQSIIGQMFSGVHCPQIDTQELDRQIKAIMSEVLPFLQEHMDDVCSSQLLTTIRRMVLRLTQQNDESKEFVRFFHKQLGGILQESLTKFAGRTLKECGEDLLVAISETLFNELAFFRLMQDFDNGSAALKKRGKKRAASLPLKETHNTREKNSPEDQSFSAAFHDEDKDKDDTEKEAVCNGPEMKEGRSCDASEREEEDDDDEGLPLSIRLSKAETQALTNYGSGEDENEDEELDEFEAGPVDVQTSLQASYEAASEQEEGTNEVPEETSQDTKLDQEVLESCDVKSSKWESVEAVDSAEEREGCDPGAAAPAATECKSGSAKLHGAGDALPHMASGPAAAASPVSSLTCSPDTDSPVMVNEDEVGSGNLSQKSDEDDFVKVEDLPLQLSVLCKEELQKRVTEEQENNNLSSDVLNGNADEQGGLLENSPTLKEPGNLHCTEQEWG
ncbi:pericentriolar material 1 protein-like isoform X2 [Megalops cyprinoides]|uniref:pericentriolar material 1 protein-like isoform X2 n=1 Tax=Megalops cyprinoides TaxID=118141 RepID=UPI001864B391|nr:pericentriolar material 1 protein-like isoform X2 [Megalops cyprinoides]